MDNLQEHLNNITVSFNNILRFGENFEATTKVPFIEFLTKNYNNYMEQFKEIFTPNKEIETNMEYFTDIRTIAKYNENIISGWLVEDFFIFLFKLDIFKEHNFILNFNSHDSDRVIKKERAYINSEPDFNIFHNGIEFKIEVQALLIPYSKFHIKKNKADRLFILTSFLLCLILTKKEIIFFYPEDISNMGILTEIKAFGNKKGYEYILKNIPKKKVLNNHSLDKKILILFYWFYFYKKYGREEFHIISNNIKENITSIDQLLTKLYKGQK